MTLKGKRNTLRANLVLLTCAMGCLVCYDIYGGLWLKGVTSSWFVLLGLVNLCYTCRAGLARNRYVLLMEAGLFFGMCADVLLGIQFFLGVGFFALGHMLYLAAFYSQERPGRRDFLCFLPVALLSLFLITGTPWIRIEDAVMKKLLMGYALIISTMVGKAVSNLLAKRTVSRWLTMLGAVLFVFSDMVLAVDMFGQSSRLTWILCSYAYWSAQNLLAHSLFHFVNEQCPAEALRGQKG